MSRKHFNAIAAAIRFCPINVTNRRTVSEALADALENFNDNFDRDRFLTACGL